MKGSVFMSVSKYSRQREAILSYLHSTTCHPTADMVYTVVRQEYPNISLGTVYRNLNQLAAQGTILRLTGIDGSDHYDGTVSPHYHFWCKDCEQILDLEMDALDHICTLAAAHFNGKIEGHFTTFHGICPKCLKKEG